MAEVGRLVLAAGVVLVVVGLVLMLAGRLHLPGDITIRRGGFTLYAPLATGLVVSIVLTVLLNLFLRGR